MTRAGRPPEPSPSELRREAEERVNARRAAGTGDSRERDLEGLVHELEVHQVELEMQQEELVAYRSELEASVERYADLYDFAPVTYLTLRADGEVVEANLAAETLIGLERRKLVGCRLGVFLAPESREAVDLFVRGLCAGADGASCEATLARADGAARQVRFDGGAAPPGPGGEPRCRVVLQDETARRRAEDEAYRLRDQLAQARKMEALGTLAGGMAHDFNNVLLIIRGYAELALERLGEADPVRADVEQVRKAGERAAALTRQLLVFSRKQAHDAHPIDLNGVVDGLLPVLERIVGEDVQLRAALAPGLRSTVADPAEIESVLLNLVANSRDSMPAGGALEIETANVEASGFPSGAAARPRGLVRLRVSDTGCGMSDEVRSRCLEPFFTTKEKGKGTGLGLSTAYGIVNRSGGELRVESEPGRGTRIVILLPSSDEAAAGTAPRAEAAGTGGSETVLVVDDEETILVVARRVLEGAGYTVLTAAGGEAALAAAGRFAGPIHLLLTDVVMPRMDGRSLADALARERPATRVLFMSGYAEEDMLRHGVGGAHPGLLRKPFGPAELAKRVRAALDAAA